MTCDIRLIAASGARPAYLCVTHTHTFESRWSKDLCPKGQEELILEHHPTRLIDMRDEEPTQVFRLRQTPVRRLRRWLRRWKLWTW